MQNNVARRVGEASASVGALVQRIGEERDGQRADNYLFRELKGVPKSLIYRLLREGKIRVNGKRIKPDTRLLAGQELTVPPVRVSEAGAVVAPRPDQLTWMADAIVHEDSELLVLNKPTGLAAHGGSGISLGAIEAIRAYKQQPGLELVHRLDRETSGLMLIAKKRRVLLALQNLMRENAVDKRYLALLCGRTERRRFQVQAPLIVSERRGGERVVRVGQDGKAALTTFTVQGRFPIATLVEATLHTGRTHQIRVHSQSIGHSIMGDDKYGDPDANAQYRAVGGRRLFLHAGSLQFQLGDRAFAFSAPLPDDLAFVLKRLQNQ